MKGIRVLLRETVDSGGHKATPEGRGVCPLGLTALVNIESGLLKIKKMRYYASILERKKTISVCKRA